MTSLVPAAPTSAGANFLIADDDSITSHGPKKGHSACCWILWSSDLIDPVMDRPQSCKVGVDSTPQGFRDRKGEAPAELTPTGQLGVVKAILETPSPYFDDPGHNRPVAVCSQWTPRDLALSSAAGLDQDLKLCDRQAAAGEQR